jgi:DNA-binding NarL/FixJ family response regulator
MALKRAAKEGPVPSSVLIADDPELLRAGTGAMLAFEPALEVVGESHDGGEVIELCKRLPPDPMLMDLPMPRMDSMPPTGR